MTPRINCVKIAFCLMQIGVQSKPISILFRSSMPFGLSLEVTVDGLEQDSAPEVNDPFAIMVVSTAKPITVVDCLWLEWILIISEW